MADAVAWIAHDDGYRMSVTASESCIILWVNVFTNTVRSVTCLQLNFNFGSKIMFGGPDFHVNIS